MSPDTSWREQRGLWSSAGEPRTVAGLAAAGTPWIALDQQHGRWDDARTLDAIELADAAAPGLPIVVRVSALDHGLIGRALDAGAAGVIVPLVDSADDARRAAAASHYPPHGARSWGPIRGGYDAASAPDVTCLVMIETAAGLDAVEQIAAVDGVTGLFVGPFDLALALGVALDDLLADGAVLRRIADAAASAGVVAGAFAGTPERADRLGELGFRFLAIGPEQLVLNAGAQALLG